MRLISNIIKNTLPIMGEGRGRGLVLILMLIAWCMPQQVWAETVQIGTAAELKAFAERVNNGETTLDAVLTANITLSGEWTRIGTEDHPYAGTFDGQFHNILGMVITCTGSHQGFFGKITGATLQNFIVSGTVTSSTADLGSIGGVVGRAENSTIKYVTNKVKVTVAKKIANNHVGGVVGSADGVTFDHCTNNGTIDAGASSECVGGIAGYATNASGFDYCNNTGAVSSTTSKAYVGGILGFNNAGSFKGIHNCLNSGRVDDGNGNFDYYTGAICGRLGSSSSGAFSDNIYHEEFATYGIGKDESGKAVKPVKKSRADYFHYQNWILTGVRTGSCGVNDNGVISFLGLDNSGSSWGDGSVTSREDLGAEGSKGSQFLGTSPVAGCKLITITQYVHSETVPAYTKLVRKSTFKTCMATNRFEHGAGLYMFSTMDSANTIPLDAMPAQNQTTLVTRIMSSTDNNGDHSRDSAYYTTGYGNLSAETATISKYVDLMHVNNATTAGTTGEEWAGFREEDCQVSYTYYAIITFNANGGTGTMTGQIIDAEDNLKKNTFTRTGYHVKAWTTKADGSGDSYPAGGTFTVTAANKGPVTLYAQWEAHNYTGETELGHFSLCECGATTGPFKIRSVADLVDFSDYVSARKDGKFHTSCNVVLEKDIDCENQQYTFKTIGIKGEGGSSYCCAYKGTFNGNGHTIHSLRISGTSTGAGSSYCNMFYWLDEATIKDLRFTDISCKNAGSNETYGFLTGTSKNSTFSNVYVQGEVAPTSGKRFAAMVGSYPSGTVSTGNTYTNCGVNLSVNMTASNSTSGTYFSGFCSSIDTKDVFTNCYFMGSFSGITESNYTKRYTSPFGFVVNNLTATFNNCYAVTYQGSYGDSYYLNKITDVTYKNPEAFQSGEVTYLLNGSTSEGTLGWFQKLGASGDAYPVLKNTGNNTVYGGYSDCFATSINVFANSAFAHTTEGHNFGSQVAQVDPTCTATGFKAYYACSYCTGKYYVDNAMHTANEVSEPVLAKYGHGYAGYADEALRGYTPTYVWSGTHDAPACAFTLLCNKCQVKMKDAEALTPSEVVADHVDQTCTSVGNATYTVTGSYNVESDASFCTSPTYAYVIPKDNHIMTEHIHVDPTCTETGNELYYTCSRSCCSGVNYKENTEHTDSVWSDIVIAALGHHNDSFGLCDRCRSELPTAETYTITESEGWGHARSLQCEVEYGIRYVRPFAAQTWATWFVPFDLSYDDQCRLGMTAGYVESIHNYDDNLDGQADRTVLNVMLLMGSNLKAGVPYLVKFDEAISGTIETSSHTLHTAADVQNVSAQTGTYIYNIVGNYSAVSAEAMNSGSRYSITDAGQMKVWGESALVPFRWSIVESEKNVTSGAPEMRIRVIGEENTETGLRSLYDTPLEYSAEGLFDLSGRRQISGKGLQVKNGKTIMLK